MAYTNYETMRFEQAGAIMNVTFDSPPINLMTLTMAEEISRFAAEVATDDSVKVMVFRSANTEYFIAHFDVEVLAEYPDQAPPRAAELSEFAAAFLSFRDMPKVSIAQIEGRARGGGSEFLQCLDMRFGVIGKTVLAQPEIAVGILPGGGGTQRLPRLIGRARAMEVIMGGMDITADVAERYGYINRAFKPEEIGPYVEALAAQISGYSHHAIALNKQSVNNAETMALPEGLIEETHLFNQLAADSDAKVRMKRFLGSGGQTYQGELDLNRILAAINTGD